MPPGSVGVRFEGRVCSLLSLSTYAGFPGHFSPASMATRTYGDFSVSVPDYFQNTGERMFRLPGAGATQSLQQPFFREDVLM